MFYKIYEKNRTRCTPFICAGGMDILAEPRLYSWDQDGITPFPHQEQTSSKDNVTNECPGLTRPRVEVEPRSDSTSQKHRSGLSGGACWSAMKARPALERAQVSWDSVAKAAWSRGGGGGRRRQVPR